MSVVGATTVAAPGTLRRRVIGGLVGLPLVARGARGAESSEREQPPARIVVVGDSQAQGLAAGLQRLYRQDRRYRVLDFARISTGLIRLGFYDWPARAQELAPSVHASTTVVMFGANDRPSVRVRGQVDDQLLRNFAALYGGRARTVIRAFRAAGSNVVWVGHPVVRNQVFSEDMAIINDICAEACRSEGVHFVPLWDVFADQDGQFIAYGPGPDGETTRLRADDGVHLTMAGYVLAAQQIRPLVTAHLPFAATSRSISW